MSDELIRKSDVLDLLNKTKVALWHDNFAGAVLIAIHDAVEDMPPVNAVELPCKIGDILFEVCVACGGIHKREVHGFNIRENGMFIVCDTTNFEKREIGKQVFLSRGEAEEALVLRQCFQQTMTEET